MNKHLENFVENNRNDFDFHEPDALIWKSIHKNVKKHKVKPIAFLKYAAALLIFVLGFATGVIQNKKHENKQPYGLNRYELKEQSQIIENEYYYKTRINESLQELEPYFINDPQLKYDIQLDFDELDAFYKKLKNDLNDDINNEHVIEAMVQSYEMKLNILKMLHQQLKQNENEDISYDI